MTHFVYIKSEPQLWTTGFYRPDGSWEAHEDFGTPEEAGNRVAFLNGGSSIEQGNEILVLKDEIEMLRDLIKTIDDHGLLATVNRLEERVILAQNIITSMVQVIGVASTRSDQLAGLLDEPMLNDGKEKEEA